MNLKKSLWYLSSFPALQCIPTSIRLPYPRLASLESHCGVFNHNFLIFLYVKNRHTPKEWSIIIYLYRLNVQHPDYMQWKYLYNYIPSLYFNNTRHPYRDQTHCPMDTHLLRSIFYEKKAKAKIGNRWTFEPPNKISFLFMWWICPRRACWVCTPSIEIILRID